MTENPNANAQSSLYAKLAKVMCQLQRLPKSGTNQEQHYKFATDADVVDTVRTKLGEAGIAFLASMTSVSQNETGAKTGKGTPIVHTVCTFEYRFIDGETGEIALNTWTGESLEWSDKGISKAATSALKYFLLKTFMISTGDVKEDPDLHTIPGGKAGSSKPEPQKKIESPAPEKKPEPPAQRPPVTEPPKATEKPHYGPVVTTPPATQDHPAFFKITDDKARDALVTATRQTYHNYGPKDIYDAVNEIRSEPDGFHGCLNTDDAVQVVAERLKRRQNEAIEADRKARATTNGNGGASH